MSLRDMERNHGVPSMQECGSRPRTPEPDSLLPTVSPSLDPDTASPKLALSEDGKSVRHQPSEQELPDDPGRFDLVPCVLGQERLSTGRYYWEVQVGQRKAWTLGVCLENVGRKGRVPKSPQHRVWALEFYKKMLWAQAFPRVLLHPPELLCRVGILLDCDAGRVSFHHVIDGFLVYVFTGLPFSAPLWPFFCLWTNNPSPLTAQDTSPQKPQTHRVRDRRGPETCLQQERPSPAQSITAWCETHPVPLKPSWTLHRAAPYLQFSPLQNDDNIL